MRILMGIFGGLLSWWGLFLIAAFDSSMIFFLPLGVDIAVVILASRSRELFWLYPVLAAAGSVCGAAVTYYIGSRLGEVGLERFVSKKRLHQVRDRVAEKGAVALATLNLLPPPFPFTACILLAGALKVRKALFFSTLGLTRLLRYGGEGVLAYFYGRQIIRWLRSDIIEYIGIALFAAAVIGSGITAIQLVRKTRAHRGRSTRKPAA
ncbi:MAG TPA: VTT domain-containing protein [Verrucomicrobiae bacterium]|nr:VTT domain-containing protein [Verrucomicrobiae bacterium]